MGAGCSSQGQVNKNSPDKRQTKSSTITSSVATSPRAQSTVDAVQLQVEQLVEKLLHEYRRSSKNFERLDRMGAVITKLRTLQITPFHNEPRREDAIDSFVQWCENNGVLFSGVNLRVTPGCGLGMWTDRKLGADEEIIRVPYEAMLTSKIGKEEFGHLIPSTVDESWLQIPIAIKLLCDRINRSEEWSAYIDVLPREFPHPNTMNAADFKFLDGSIAFQESIDLWVEMVHQYCLIFNHFIYLTKRGKPLPIPLQSFTYDAYLWSITIALTRSLKIQSGDEPLTALVPFWDMCNHGPETVSTALHNEYLSASTMNAHSENDQILICYRESTTSEFFTVWGLVAPDHTYSPLKVALTSDFAHFKTKKATLEKLGLQTTHDFKILKDASYPLNARDIRYLMVMFLSEEDMNWPFSGTLQSTTWSKAWQALAGRLAYTLKEYPRSVAECQALLKSPEVHGERGAQLALRQVIAEQEVLEKARQRAIALSRQEPPGTESNLYQRIMSQVKPQQVSVES